jgi:hypothetical protein
LLGITNSVLSQQVTISGYVADKTTGEYLIGVNVFDTTNYNGCITNKYGYYSIKTEKGKIGAIRYSFVGYSPITLKQNFAQDTTINIKLISGTNLSEVKVISSKKELLEHRTEISKVDIPLKQIKTLPSLTGEPDILKAYQLMPGVQSGPEGNNGLYVRGGTPDQNLFLLDDVPLYNVSHLGGLYSVFDPSMVKSVELYKGGFLARYGGRVSAVVDVRNKDGNLYSHHGEMGLSIFLSKLFLEGPIVKEKISYAISLRRSNLDIYSFLLGKMVRNSEIYGYTFYDINLKTNYIISDRDRLFLSIYNGRDKFFYRLKEEVSSYDYLSKYNTSWGNNTASIRWYHVFSGRLFNNFTLAYTKYQYKNYNFFRQNDKSDNSVLSDEYQFLSNVQDVILKTDIEMPFDQNKLRTGFMYVRHFFNPGSVSYSQEIRMNQIDTVLNSPEPSLHLSTNELTAYVEYEWHIKNRLSGNFGINSDYYFNNNKGFASVEPRILLNYLILQNFSIKASYCMMQQNLHLLTNSNAGLPSDIWLPSTSNVKPERSQQIALGLAHTTKNGYEVSIESYIKCLSNLIDYKEGALIYMSSLNWEEKIETGGSGLVRGLEFLLQKKEGRMNGWVGYTISKNDRKFKNLNNGKSFPFIYDQRHEFSIVVNYELSKKLSLSGTWVYHTGHAITLPTGKYQLIDINSYNPENVYKTDDVHIYSEKNGYRLPAYHRLDFGLNYTKPTEKGIKRWTIGIYNAYNRQNAYYLYFKTKDGVTRLYQQSLFPLIVNFGYTFTF